MGRLIQKRAAQVVGQRIFSETGQDVAIDFLATSWFAR